jgi:hypothetical protein
MSIWIDASVAHMALVAVTVYYAVLAFAKHTDRRTYGGQMPFASGSQVDDSYPTIHMREP